MVGGCSGISRILRCRANGDTLDWRFGDDFAAYMLDDDEQFGQVIGQVICPDGAFQP